MSRYSIPQPHISLILCTLLYLTWLQPVVASANSDNYTSPTQIQLISALAKAGRADAQFTLAGMYLAGRGVDQDIDTGRQWLEKAALQGHGESQNQLGLLYLNNNGMQLNCQSASHWFSQVTENSPVYPQAQSNLAWLLATCPEPSARDGARAVQIIQQLLGEKHANDAGLLDTLAAAYAETGQFDRAIATQQQAIALLEKQETSGPQWQRFTQRLQKYHANQPWRISSSH